MISAASNDFWSLAFMRRVYLPWSVKDGCATRIPSFETLIFAWSFIIEKVRSSWSSLTIGNLNSEIFKFIKDNAFLDEGEKYNDNK